jgi:hypothetical protein
MNQTREQKPVKDHKIVPAHENRLVQAQIAKAELKNDQDDNKINVEPDPLEYHQREDSGESDEMIAGKSAATPFDREPDSVGALIKHLPRRARPVVRYFIDENFEVHRLDNVNDSVSHIRHHIARAIAVHVRNSNVLLINAEDWRNIPSLSKQIHLLDLIPDEDLLLDASDRSKKVKSVTLRNRVATKIKDEAEIKNFAILLHNGDVITPDTILEDAKMDKSATRAGALRASAKRQENMDLAGEIWDADDWETFDKTQRQNTARNRKVTKKKTLVIEVTRGR